MKTLVFEGHSDDTFGEYGVTMDDYDCCASGRMIAYRVTLPHDASQPGDGVLQEGMIVVGQYGSKDWTDSQPGCWVIGIQQLDEDVQIPGWPMRWGITDRGYSPRLEIDVPDGIRVECMNRKS